MKTIHQKKITQEAIILRHMRHTRKLSLNQAGRLVGITGSAVAHFEQGRTTLSRARIETFLEAFRYTRDEYLEFFDSAALPINLRDECLGIVKHLDDAKLQAVHSVLVNFMPLNTMRSNSAPRQPATLR
ncbi:helix-turn-helix transcriptional regulator [Bdellovibrionota bacterium FG-1]